VKKSLNNLNIGNDWILGEMMRCFEKLYLCWKFGREKNAFGREKEGFGRNFEPFGHHFGGFGREFEGVGRKLVSQCDIFARWQ